MRPSDVRVGSFWASPLNDYSWGRVRVMNVNPQTSEALINYIDYGYEEAVEVNSLQPLTRLFANYPALAVKCCLANISANGESGENWSIQSSEYFASLTSDKVLTAFIAHKPKDFDFDSALEVFLWTNDSSEPIAKDILINSNLVNNNYAKTEDNEWVKDAERGQRETTPEEVMSKLIPKIANINHIQMNGSHTSHTSNGQQINGTNRTRIVPELPSNSDDSYDDEDWDPTREDDDYRRNYNVNHQNIGVKTLGYRMS